MELPVCSNIELAKFVVLDDSKTKIQWKCPETYTIKMMEASVDADITFIVAEGGSVKAHRDVLARLSPVFAAMFSHDLKEKLTAVVNIPDMTIDKFTVTMKISDMTRDGLKLFLLLLYNTKDNTDVGVPELNPAIDLHFKEFHAAVKKYQVGKVLGCLYDCALARNLNPDNCWIYMKQSSGYGEGAFRTCYNYITANYDDVIKSSSFLDAMKLDPEKYGI